MITQQEILEQSRHFQKEAVCFGSGDINSEIAIVLEYPSGFDCKTGKALSGNAGQLLFKILNKYGIKQENCYLTCAIKRRCEVFSDSFTKISNTELNCWRTILEAELRGLKNLKHILILGKYALQILTGEQSVMDWRGSVLDFGKNVDKTVTFNPTMIYREPKWEVIFKFDLYKFNLVCSGKFTDYKIEHLINPTYQEAMRWIYKMRTDGKPVALDIEVTHNETACVGLTNDPHKGMCINFRTHVGNQYTLKEEINIKRALCQLVNDPKVKLVLQNGSFDTTWLGFKDRFPVFKSYFDTLLAHHTLYPRLPHNLGFLTSIYTTHPYYKDDGKSWREGGDINQYWRYNVKDVCITLKVFEGLLVELKKQGMDKFFFDHVMRLQPHLCNMTVQGVKVDTALKESIRQELTKEIAEKVEEFNKLVEEFLGMHVPINMNSPKDLGLLIYDLMKLPDFHNKKKTDEETITRLIALPQCTEQMRNILNIYMEYKKQIKFFSTYIETKIDPDGRIRCEYKQYGVQNAPGRLSSSAVLWGSGANLQNQPQAAYKMYIADEGYSLIYFDLKQAEAKVVAYGWNVKKLKEAFELCAKDSTKDVHRMNASNIFKVPYDEIPSFDRHVYGKTTDDPKMDSQITLRYLGKRCVHGLNYRMQVDRLAQTTGISLEMAREAYTSYHASFPEIQQAWKKTIEEVKNTKMLFNFMGRRLFFLEAINENNLDSVIAFRPQSTIGDYVSSIIYDVEEDPEFPKDKARCLLNIHDALVFLVHNDVKDLMLKLVWKHANKPININGEDVVIGMDFKVSVPDELGVHRWSTLKSYDYKEEK